MNNSTNFRLRPYLEEEDGQDLGYNDNVFCDSDGPYCDFTVTANGQLKFSGTTNNNGTRGWFTTSSGQTGSNDSMTLDDGDDEYFYIVMKEKGSSNDDTCQFEFKISWDWND